MRGTLRHANAPGGDPRAGRRGVARQEPLAASIALLALFLLSARCGGPAPLFEEVTRDSGIFSSGQSYGAAWGDLDGDGRPDLWLPNHGDPPHLLRNFGGAGFVNFAQLLVGRDEGDVHAAAWVDVDNDGDQDIVEIGGAGGDANLTPNRVFVNTAGQLVDRAAELGLDLPLGRGRTAQWWDWDGDGWLDVAIHNARREDGQDPSGFYVQRGEHFEPTGLLAAVAGGRDLAFAQLADLDDDGDPEMMSHGWPQPNRIYDLDPGGFSDATDHFGLPDLVEVKDAAIGDFDGDLEPDVFLAVTGSRYSQLSHAVKGELRALLAPHAAEHGFDFAAEGPVTVAFDWWALQEEEVFIGSTGASPQRHSFTLDPLDPMTHGLAPHVSGVDLGAYLGFDPAQGVWQVRFSAPARGRLGLSIAGESISDAVALGFTGEAQGRQDRLFLMEGGVLVDRTEEAGLDAPTECESVAAGDFDNDRDLDLFLVCTGPAGQVPNRLYLNDGDGTFAVHPLAGGASGTNAGRGDAVAVADYDRDGFLDLFVTNGRGNPPLHDGPHQLFRNRGNQNHWLQIDLEGTTSNRDGIGARVTLTAGGTAQVRAQRGGFHGRAQDQKRLHFGLGPSTVVDELEVVWPSGIVQVLSALEADRIIAIVEP